MYTMGIENRYWVSLQVQIIPLQAFFATEFLYGDSFVIEVYEKSVGASRFNIDNLYYLFEGNVFGPTDILKESMNSTYDIMSAACHNDVTCHASYTSVAKSVVKMLVGGGTCSGVLIGNTSGDFTPYVLTADHCLGGGNPATIVFYFNYTSASCNSSTVSFNYGTLTGATVRARRPRRDMLLLELSSRPALDVYYAGWDRTGNIPSSAYIIHHPDGDLKKISFENDSLLTNTYTPGGILGAYDSMVHWWLELDNGTTEGGSSGAPYFDSNGRVIGAHSGRNFVTSDYCTDLEVLGYKLSENWTAANSNERLVDWLDPSSSGSNTLLGASGPAVPTVPQNLIISNEDMDVELFELQWNASANTTHYYVDRCEVPYLYASFCVWSNSVATVYTNAYQDGQIIIVQYPQPGISHIYEFRVRAANTYFTSAPSNIVSYWGERVNPDKIPTSLPKNELLPTEVSFQAYPNPFNGGTTVSFISEEPVIAGTRYSISIYDVLGRKVREFEGIFSENGRFNHSLDFSSLNSGQYIVVANVISSVGKSRYATLSVTHLK